MPPAWTRAAIRKQLHDLARVWLGLNVRSARRRGFDLEPYNVDEWHARRLLHFERLLTEVEDLPGRIVECGVGAGRSLFAFAVITQHVARPREIWGFDTFQGMPPAGPEDGEHNADKAGNWNCGQEQVIESLKLAGITESFIADKVTLVAGRLQDSLPAYDGGPIALLHLDMDWYASCRTALELLYDHVVAGGVVALGGYGRQAWPGPTRAMDEFFHTRPEELLESPVADLHYVVKGRAAAARHPNRSGPPRSARP